MPDVEIQVVDESGSPLIPGQVGEIVIRSDRNMRGYYGQQDSTHSTLRDGWLHTRDLGWIDEGGYVYLAGRASDMIIRGGENIAPQEIEVVLETHPAVEEAAAFGVPDEEWGEQVAAAVVLHEGQSTSPAELRDFCRQHIGGYKAPVGIYMLPVLPRNALGKLVRKDLLSVCEAALRS